MKAVILNSFPSLLPGCRFHFSSKEVVNTADYVAWYKHFGPITKHIFCGRGTCDPSSSFISSTLMNHKLNALQPKLFPKVHHDRFMELQSLSEFCTNRSSNVDYHNHSLIRAASLMKLCIYPAKQKSITFYDNKNCIQELTEFYDQIDQTKLHTDHLFPATATRLDILPTETYDNRHINLGQSDVKFSFLGTGCAAPSRNRNVSGIAVYINQKNISPTHEDENIRTGGYFRTCFMS
jgi:hypothetical protein